MADNSQVFTADCNWCDTHERHDGVTHDQIKSFAKAFLLRHHACAGGRTTEVKLSGDGEVLVKRTLRANVVGG